jgi:hypothetical protein
MARVELQGHKKSMLSLFNDGDWGHKVIRPALSDFTFMATLVTRINTSV